MHVAAAISDPVRRQIMTMLNDRSMGAGAIAARFEISRPAVSRHLRVLRECGLVVDESRGRERLYRLEKGPLAQLEMWLDQFRDPWPGRLDALETEVYRARRDRRAIAPTHKENTA
ncbi:MAG TPA: metalloregulator ArsR/SmtB family transcription factor [Ilumatobacteraceae bacterium]|nr:metalloregulator ArsR/SmtB family transcription factor [Ilumatobacteraceae bacterium]